MNFAIVLVGIVLEVHADGLVLVDLMVAGEGDARHGDVLNGMHAECDVVFSVNLCQDIADGRVHVRLPVRAGTAFADGHNVIAAWLQIANLEF